jgi:hypothetical protein
LKQSATNRMSDITLEEIAKLSELAGPSTQFGRGLNVDPKTRERICRCRQEAQAPRSIKHFQSHSLSACIQSPEMEEV